MGGMDVRDNNFISSNGMFCVLQFFVAPSRHISVASDLKSAATHYKDFQSATQQFPQQLPPPKKNRKSERPNHPLPRCPLHSEWEKKSQWLFDSEAPESPSLSESATGEQKRPEGAAGVGYMLADASANQKVRFHYPC